MLENMPKRKVCPKCMHDLPIQAFDRDYHNQEYLVEKICRPCKNDKLTALYKKKRKMRLKRLKAKTARENLKK